MSAVTNVSFENQIACIKQYANERIDKFEGGMLRHFETAWRELTNDPEIIHAVTGLKVPFLQPPIQNQLPSNIQFSEEEITVVHKEVEKLLQKKVIVETTHESNEFVSNIFVREKKDQSYRMILNLKNLNSFIPYCHFKMDTLVSAIRMMKPDCYMASIDYKDAYYSVPVADSSYFKFYWDGVLYKFVAMPQGLACAPRIFTKILKPAYSHLRKQGHQSIGYIDDSFLQGDTLDDCRSNVLATSKLFSDLGFVIHPEKSVLTPSKTLVFLGFVLDSSNMRVSLTQDKALKLQTACRDIVKRERIVIREVAKLLGLMVSSLPGVQHGQLFYRSIENDKIIALKEANGKYEKKMTLSDKAREDIQWWIDNVRSAFKPISHRNPDLIIESDASTKGWGAHHRHTGAVAGGEWSVEESNDHINVLEMKAAMMALTEFAAQSKNIHIRLMLDNTTAVSYIKEMGGSHSADCNAIARAIWDWAIARNIWLSASHLPGALNVVADRASRIFHDDTEWMLNKSVFETILNQFMIEPNIDLFASAHNYQIQPYVAWKPDREAFAIDAFTLDWSNILFYAFPPFSVIQLVIQKIIHDKSSGIIIVPEWPTQSWFPSMMRLLIDFPIHISRHLKLLTLPNKSHQQHALWKKLNLLACYVSGQPSRTSAFLTQLSTSYLAAGDHLLTGSMTLTSPSGTAIVVKGKKIPMKLLSVK